MAVPNYLGFAQRPGVLQTAIGTMGTLQQQAAQREQMGLAQQAGQRAQALASPQLQQAQEAAREQPVLFQSNLANAVAARHLQAAQAAKALAPPSALSLKGPAGDAASLLSLKKQYGENSEVYKNAIKEFQTNIDAKKQRAAFYGSNVWQKNMTTLQKTQLNEGFQKENAARQKQGLPILTMDQYAVAAGYKPSDDETKADAIDAHIREVQLNQVKNGQPITPTPHILNHIIKGGDATQLPGAQAPQGKPTTASFAGSTTVLAPLPAGLQAPGSTTVLAPLPAGLQAQGAPQVPQQQAPGQAIPQNIPQQPLAATPQQIGAQPQQAGVPKLITTPSYRQQASQTGLSTIRQTSDQQNRSKIVYGNQAENTVNNMLPDLDAIAAYSGPAGSAKLLADRNLFQQTGKPSQQYLAYQRFIANSALLNDQVTQYFGKSIVPSAREELDQITTPRNWIDSPAATKEKFNAFIKTLRQEINIRKDALQNPEAYYSDKTKGPKAYSDKDYTDTAKKYGMTVDELKQYLASKKGASK